MEYVKRAFGVAGFCFFIGWIAIPIPGAVLVGETAFPIGFILLVGSSAAWLIIRLKTRNAPSFQNVFRLLMFIIFGIFLPFGVVALASSGATIDAFFPGNGTNWEPWSAKILMAITQAGLYLTLIELPYFLYRYSPRQRVSEKANTLVPAWGSGVAATLTGLLILEMHLARGPLADVSITPLFISAIAVATLLAPFFKWLIITLWTFGIADTLNGSRWRKTFFEVAGEIQTISDHLISREHLNQCETCRAHIKNCNECRESIRICAKV